jgi:hypothetical protein
MTFVTPEKQQVQRVYRSAASSDTGLTITTPFTRCSYWNQPDPFGIMVTQNGPNLDYAGSCARKPPSLAVALNCGTG